MVHIKLLLHRSAFIIFFIILEVLAVCAAASVASKIGDIALCPFEVEIDFEPARLPKEIKQHTCRKSVSRNTNKDDDSGESPLTCADIGGHCVQVHETIKVTYRHRTLNHRKHDVRVNMSCSCVPLRGRPATPILPEITR